jgi:hypothetical protein
MGTTRIKVGGGLPDHIHIGRSAVTTQAYLLFYCSVMDANVVKYLLAA